MRGGAIEGEALACCKAVAAPVCLPLPLPLPPPLLLPPWRRGSCMSQRHKLLQHKPCQPAQPTQPCLRL